MSARRCFAPSLLGQVLALVLLSVLAAQAVNVAVVFLIPPPPPEFYRLSELAAVLKAEGAPLRARTGRSLQAELLAGPRATDDPFPSRVSLFLKRSLADKLGAQPDQVRLSLLDARTGRARRGYRIMRSQFMPDARPGARQPVPERPPRERPSAAADAFVIVPFEAGWRRPDGRWWVLRVTEGGLLAEWQKRVLLGIGLALLAMCPIAYLFARRLSAPIAAFAGAAERLGRDPGASPLALRGPKEVEAAASAFNQMQDRLNRYVADRTEMVGAIAHDLRTPLTRLRFRIEEAPAGLRAKMAGDLDQMEAMIAATLAFVRDATRRAERLPLDLYALVESVMIDMADTGLDVVLAPGDRVLVEGDPVALRRLATNLLDNAVKFGKRARVRVDAADGAACVEVEDDGPGIPEEQRERVFEPFHRGERSRSRATGGTGLGLAVVRSIARAHGGDVRLGEAHDGGLRAELRLPLLANVASKTAGTTHVCGACEPEAAQAMQEMASASSARPGVLACARPLKPFFW